MEALSAASPGVETLGVPQIRGCAVQRRTKFKGKVKMRETKSNGTDDSKQGFKGTSGGEWIKEGGPRLSPKRKTIMGTELLVSLRISTDRKGRACLL